MTDEEYEGLKENLKIKGEAILPDDVNFVETHISYLLLLKNFAYKIKKTLKLPFLDFSRLEDRKNACTQELLLNRRLAPDIYKSIVPIQKENGSITVDSEGSGETVDYAVLMKRLDNNLEMDQLLENESVSELQLDQLAEMIAHFHKKAFKIHKSWKISDMQDTYNELNDWQKFASENLDSNYAKTIQQSCDKSDQFLSENIDKINNRSHAGMVRDLHGDLHSRNIFLTDPPVIFDCIEFNEDLRQIDILNEIAFFLMDLEYYQAKHEMDFFIKNYLTRLKGSDLEDCWDDSLVLYFKMYRASVRAKVLMISAQKTEAGDRERYLNQVKRYLDLVNEYTQQMT